MEARPEADPTERRLFVALAAILVVVLLVVGGRKLLRKHAHGRAKPKAVAVAAKPAKVADPVATPPKVVAPDTVEIWIRNPETISRFLLPPVLGMLNPNAPPAAIPTSLSQLLKNGDPSPETQRDLDQLDPNQPIGIVFVDGEDPQATGYVVAVAVKDEAVAPKHFRDFTARNGATREPSAVLGVDTFKGTRSGRSVALVRNQVLIGSDRIALERGAARLAAGLPKARSQAHDLSLVGPPTALRKWLGNVVRGAAGVGMTTPLFVLLAEQLPEQGALGVELVLDVDQSGAALRGGLLAAPGSPLSDFLSSYPTTSLDTLNRAPRESVEVTALRLPKEWIETTIQSLIAVPPGVQVPEAQRADFEKLRAEFAAVAKQVAGVLEGETLASTTIDANGAGVQTTSWRAKVVDDAAARAAMHAVLVAQTKPQPGAPPSVKAPAITPIDGGEGAEFDVAPQPGAPNVRVGFAYVVRDGHLFFTRGVDAKAKAVAQSHAEGAHADGAKLLSSDGDAKAKLATLPARFAAAHFMAPLREATGIAAASKQPANTSGVILAVWPESTGVRLMANLDMPLFAAFVAQNLFAPLLAPPPGSLPPGALPPDAAQGMPGMVPPGVGGPTATPKSQPRPAPPPPPAPTGYVLPLPTHRASP
jgi:hypothetical protein